MAGCLPQAVMLCPDKRGLDTGLSAGTRARFTALAFSISWSAMHEHAYMAGCLSWLIIIITTNNNVS